MLPGSTLVVAPSDHLVCHNEAAKGYQSQRIKAGNRWPHDAAAIRIAIPADHLLAGNIPDNLKQDPHLRISDLEEEHTMPAHIRKMLVVAAMISAAPPALADVITDWDEKAVTIVSAMSPYDSQRIMAMVHAAMFDAVNSIERRYRPYLVHLPAPPNTSKEAAAAAAAAVVLASINEKTASGVRDALAVELASIPDGPAKSDGIKLGETVAAKVLEARANDGHDAPDAYRPRTSPGVYVPTPITAASVWPNMKPFAIKSASQFRPKPPISLTSKEWATDYNEIKDYGSKTSTKRTPQQTETARFWLMVGPQAYHPLARQLVKAKQMSVSDSARFMTFVALGLNDALIAVFDAKYHYNFWRPITSIRNGDIDNNPATEREATWQPIDNTPMHPEYPCAHCILSGTMAGIVKTALGSAEIPEVALTSPAARGVTHRFTNMTAFADEVANARIWAGFHYRFSTRVGTDMGGRIGEHVVTSVLQPAGLASGR